jgi:hypothetical protein
MRLAISLCAAYVLAVAALTGPLKAFVPDCPVTFGFCYERASR